MHIPQTVYDISKVHAIMRVLYRVKQLILLAGDLVCFFIGFSVALIVRNGSLPDLPLIERHFPLFLFVFFLWIVVNYVNGLYDLVEQPMAQTTRRLAEAAALSLILSITFFYLLPRQTIAPKTILLLTIVAGYSLSALWRFSYHHLVHADRLYYRITFVGYTPEVAELIEMIGRHPERGYRIERIIEKNQPPTMPPAPIAWLDDIRHTSLFTKPNRNDIVVIAPHIRQDAATLETVYQLLFVSVQLIDLMSFYELVTGRIPPVTFSESWFLEHLRRRAVPIYDHIRTVVDYAASICLGLLSLILFPCIALAIRINSPGPVLIRQKRVGKNGIPFTLYKFRSMYALTADGSAEMHGVQFATKDDKRITPVGRILRRTRLDELPQAWNLLKRDVTLIGPRPERPEIVEALEHQMPYYSLRHVVRPGLTGWALLHQDYTDTMETSLQKLQYDLYYIKNCGPLLDLAILLKTLNKIIRLKGQ